MSCRNEMEIGLCKFFVPRFISFFILNERHYQIHRMTRGTDRMKELVYIGPQRAGNSTQKSSPYVLSIKCLFCATESRFQNLNCN